MVEPAVATQVQCNDKGSGDRPVVMRRSPRRALGLLAAALVVAACNGQAGSTTTDAQVVERFCDHPSGTGPAVPLATVTPVRLARCDVTVDSVLGSTDVTAGSPAPASQNYYAASLDAEQWATLRGVLQTPTERDPEAVCPAIATIGIYSGPLYLQLADGRIIVPNVPTQRCGQPLEQFVQFMDSLQYTVGVTT